MKRAISSSKGMLGSAGKWFTAFLTTCAALATLLVNAQNLGLTAWLGSVDLGITAHAARRILVSPRADTLTAIGDTTVLAATVTDRRGAVLLGALLDWKSEDSNVAVVDSGGLVVARGPGSARITASVRDLVAGAQVIVIQRPDHLLLVGDSSTTLLEGDSLRLIAHTVDARGHRIRAQAPRWRSGDSTIVAVDSSGLATARTPGRTTLRATAGGLEAAVAVQVSLTPATLGILSGSGQRAAAGRPLPEPIVVLVLSRGGLPVPGSGVTLSAEGGMVEPATAVTDKTGRIRAEWILGPRPGPQRLRARAQMLDSTVTVTAEADPVPGNTRIELAGDVAGGAVSEPLSRPVVVRVTDSAGAPLADVPIHWAALDHGGVTASAERTDSLGQAAAQWTLGPRAGTQRLRAEVGNPRTLSPYTITATGLAGAAVTAVLRAGQAQRGTAGKPLPQPIAVAVLDARGNGVAGAVVIARPAQGTVAESTATTDAQGRASLRWTLGQKAGEQKLDVRVAGLETNLRINAEAVPGPAAGITLHEVRAKAPSGTAVGIVATVTDAHGNPVHRAAVSFAASTGRLAPARAVTDDSGHAATNWTPGTKAAEQTLTARLSGTTLSGRYTFKPAQAAVKRRN